MNKRLKIVLLIIALIIVFIVSGFLLPSKYRVKRSVVIARNDSSIFEQINSPRKWTEWVMWNEKMDSTASYQFRGPESGVGSEMEWQGKKIGQGIMTIKESVPYRLVKYNLLMENGSLQGVGAFMLTPEKNGCRLTWQDEGELGDNPLFRWVGFLLMDSILGGAFEEGLNKLKSNLEKAK
jgi:uncharacterized protein YndB with AHSA1/START domain